MVSWESTVVILLVLVTLYYFLKPSKAPIEIVDLIYYPIKSCGGIHVFEAEINERGIIRDREWAIMKRPNIVVTQKVEARLFRLQPNFEYEDDIPKYMVLKYGDRPPCKVDLTQNSDFTPFEFDFHGAPGTAVEVSQHASEWIKETFQEEYFLAHIEGLRNCKQSSKPEIKDRVDQTESVNFQDMFHMLVCTEESYEEMLRHLPSYKVDDVCMLNMRPNIVVRNASTPFDEDFWENFTIGNLKFQGIGECSRCKLITVSPKTFEHDPNNEPNKTLQRIHGDEIKGYFGVWAQAKNAGRIKTKDQLIVKTRRETSRLHRLA
eukprot:CAMPEP_0204916040 /NCGR_PEP_ID=MMETSP1397-20131031/13948_1 /ASSEMBLY_ACC=CAM_ASM_000891 /TAXON_ID=49980 /ORGANISM="Climacostomum Climacostomum virens, Strain Stock W-24" /LENGTH=319 /DNA_ID=CAMNT_0052088381 /DNA_START=8 /DNA_END=964 /DNA_ORIENTATION=+